MAGEWAIRASEKDITRRLCTRVYETLDDLLEDVTYGRHENDDPGSILRNLREQLGETLPHDPPTEEG